MKNKRKSNTTLRRYGFKPSLSGYKEQILFGLICFGLVIIVIKYLLNNNIVMQNNPLFLAVAGLCLFIPFGYLSKLIISVKSTSYILSPERLTVKKGVTRRTISNLELWRVTDVQFHQNAIQLMLGEGYIEMLTKDASDPVLKIKGLTKNKGEKIYSIITEYVAYSLQTGGVLHTVK